MDTNAPLVVGRDFFERARKVLTLDVPPALTDLALTDFPRGDLDRDPAAWDEAGVTATRPAAVLVPVVDHPEPGVLLTMRTSDLPNHGGQIAFPGGKIDPGDATPLAAPTCDCANASQDHVTCTCGPTCPCDPACACSPGCSCGR